MCYVFALIFQYSYLLLHFEKELQHSEVYLSLENDLGIQLPKNMNSDTFHSISVDLSPVTEANCSLLVEKFLNKTARNSKKRKLSRDWKKSENGVTCVKKWS